MVNHYKILSINGGGVRGLVPAKIIERITTIANKPIHELFDYVVGTSAGGIIAVSLTVQDEYGKPRYSASEVVKIFKDEAQEIFPPSPLGNIPYLRDITQLFTAKYSRSGIDNLLESKLGNATFLNTTMPITTISYSLDSDGPRLWSKYRAENEPEYHNYFLKDAAGATSAAPTFFPIKVTKAPNGEKFHDVDGGIFANSPTMIGVSEFLNYKGIQMHSDKLTVVSIGTGRFKDEPLPPTNTETDHTPIIAGALSGLAACFVPYFLPMLALPAGVACKTAIIFSLSFAGYKIFHGDGGIGWIAKGNLVERMMKGAEVSDAFQSKIVEVIRINPTLDKEFRAMDNSGSVHIHKFEKEIDSFIKKHDIMLKKVVDCLNSDGSGEECSGARSHTAQFSEDFYAELTGIHHIDF